MKSRDILIYLSLKYGGKWDLIFNAIQNKEMIKEDEANVLLQTVKAKTLTLLDDEYPNSLKNIYKPPFVLYYYGDVSLLSGFEQNIGVVGSRKASNYGNRMTQKIIEGFKGSYTIVSGMAKGIDTTAAKTAVNCGSKTIAVLGTGIDHCYPKENQDLYEKLCKSQLVLSEYPNDVSGTPDNFPVRNRIIAGLCKGLLVTEAYDKSGSMITAALANEYGRTVCCIPYPADSNSSCNKLIQQGAVLVETAEDVIEQMGLEKNV